MLSAELSAGLGNRMLALASAIHLSQDTAQPLEIIWNIGNGFGARFEDLFDATAIPDQPPVYNIYRGSLKRHPIDRIKSLSIIRRLERESTLLLRSGAITAIYEDGYGYRTLKRLTELEKNIHIDAYSYYFPDNRLEHKNFTMIQPSKEVLTFAESTLSHIDAHTYGFHIRRSDHIDAIRHSPLSLFTEKMQQLLTADAEATFFLATDDAETAVSLQTQFGNKLILQSQVNLSRTNKQGAFCAYTDMLALSKCKEIFGSYGSTFSLVASLMTDTPLHVLSTKTEG